MLESATRKIKKCIKAGIGQATGVLEYLYYKYLLERIYCPVDGKQRFLLYVNKEDPKKIADLFPVLFPSLLKQKIAKANTICDHIFDLLGSGLKRVEKQANDHCSIDWHLDFKSGYHWDSRIFYRRIRAGHPANVEIKVPWELSRCQHLIALGQAYLLTGSRHYADEVEAQINDWTRSNPVGFGVNWKCPMDVAIRMVNWLVAMEYFRGNPFFDIGFMDRLYASIRQHARFVYSHLERHRTFTNNHYLANIAGLFIAGIYCPFFSESRRWIGFAISELHWAMERQVFPDGCYFEASTAYHRLALEMFFYCHFFGVRAGIQFSERYEQRLKAMFTVVRDSLKPDGTIPQIGDNDSGRFILLSERAVLDLSYLLSLAAIHFDDHRFKLPGMSLSEEALWIWGAAAEEKWGLLPEYSRSVEAKEFQDGGWYILRNGADVCVIACGPFRFKSTEGHAHNDKLSIELTINGVNVLVDPGTYVYTPCPDKRNMFRSTGYHNTVAFGNFEQNDLSIGLFALPETVALKYAHVFSHDGVIGFKGKIRYKDFRHTRSVAFKVNEHLWEIRDRVKSPPGISISLSYHLAPGLAFRNKSIWTCSGQEPLAHFDISVSEVETTSYAYSPEYGVSIDAQKIIARFDSGCGDQTIYTRIKRVGSSIPS
jgi:hypothetical protein